jgi:hypothetical protein
VKRISSSTCLCTIPKTSPLDSDFVECEYGAGFFSLLDFFSAARMRGLPIVVCLLFDWSLVCSSRNNTANTKNLVTNHLLISRSLPSVSCSPLVNITTPCRSSNKGFFILFKIRNSRYRPNDSLSDTYSKPRHPVATSNGTDMVGSDVSQHRKSNEQCERRLLCCMRMPMRTRTNLSMRSAIGNSKIPATS